MISALAATESSLFKNQSTLRYRSQCSIFRHYPMDLIVNSRKVGDDERRSSYCGKLRGCCNIAGSVSGTATKHCGLKRCEKA